MHKPLLPITLRLALAWNAPAADPATLDLAGATVRHARHAVDLERFAARETAFGVVS